MEQDNLFQIMQNIAIGAISMHSFTLGYNKISKNRKEKICYPKLEYMFYILPIVYNKSAMQTFKSSSHSYTALLENKTIVLDLQERANKMSQQTFDSLNLAFSKKILNYNNMDKTIEINKGFQTTKLQLLLSMNQIDNSVKNIQDSAFKLGCIFAKRDKRILQNELKIKF